MFLLIFFAFLAGIVTVLSPCILPILPIVLSGSIGGGKRRPFGVITGFILSFTFFTLFLATIVQSTGISADIVRNISIIIVLLFGISLLIPQFQVLVERLFSRLSGLIPQRQQGTGYFSGVLIGISLGLVWTPCVGPILASVISLALTGSVTTTAFFITFAYAIGTAIPLLAITYGGRSLLQKVPWLLSRSGEIQKAFGVLMILTALGIFFNIDRKFQTYILETFPNYGIGLTQFEDNDAVKEQLEKLNNEPADNAMNGKTTAGLLSQKISAPELIAGGEWFNTTPLTLKELRGKVVLIDFWTYTCINCIRTLPYLRDWHAKYKDKGLVIIGVHTPEFEFEKNAANVQNAISDFKLQYPVMQDNNYATWRAYENRYWPAKYFIDKNGFIRSTHFGEGEYAESEKIIQKLLAETGEKVEVPINNQTYTIEAKTPEIYLGYDRMEYLAPPQDIIPDTSMQHRKPQEIPLNTFAFDGTWTVDGEFAMPDEKSSLLLHFYAKDVFLVMRPKSPGLTGQVKLYLDGTLLTTGAGEDVQNGTVTITTDRLYKLLQMPLSGDHILRIEFLDNHLELYAFTFG